MDSLPSFLEDTLLEDYDEAMEVTKLPKSSASVIVVSEAGVGSLPEPATIVDAPMPAETEPVNDAVAPVDRRGSETESAPAQPTRQNSLNCSLCKKPHPLRGCFQFRQLPHEKKLRHVLTFGHCSRCLATGHPLRECASQRKCLKCHGQHNTLLCSPTRSASTPTKTQKTKKKPSKPIQPRPLSPTALPLRHSLTLSPTLQVKLILGDKSVQVRGVVDLCCSMSYISADLVKRLRIPVADSHCRVCVGSLHDPTKRISVTVKVTKMKGIKTPIENLNESVRALFPGFQYADPTFYHSGQVAIVFGPEVGSLILTGQSFSNPCGLLAQHTIFGWVISGIPPPL